jgi:hypothetical protein
MKLPPCRSEVQLLNLKGAISRGDKATKRLAG